MKKRHRQDAIKNLIENELFFNQDELLTRLISMGFNITQATLSRDMKEMKVAKVPTADGTYAYALAESNPTLNNLANSMLQNTLVRIEFSGQLAVIKTRPGYAMAIAGEIDEKASDVILGTVAGDDTILLIPREKKTRAEIINALSTFIPDIK